MNESEMKHRSDGAQIEDAIASDAETQLLRGDGRTARDEEIRARAYELYRERGGSRGDDMSDWLRAEAECLGRLHGTAGAGLGGQRDSNSIPPESHV